jgi:tetratricopeptide (TPR) repeat protein
MAEGRYRAFISYSHADDKWAGWLHRSLEAYKPPKKLVGKKTDYGYVPARLGAVFRDREELPTATDLGAVINEALANSATQIVVCSPAAARSKWVNEEIKAFKRLGREDRILCLIIDGEPNASELPGREDEECFPAALRFKLGPDGELSDERTEPIAADARPNKDGKLNAKLKLISGMLGVGFDALAQREMHRRNRRIMSIAAGSVAGMVMTSALAVLAMLAREEANTQRIRAEQELNISQQTEQVLTEILSYSDPSQNRGEEITVREVLDIGAERIERELSNQPEVQTRLMQTIGSVYNSLNRFDRAQPLLERALERRRQLSGAQHVEVAALLSTLGDTHKGQAEYAQSEQLYQEALAILEAEVGEDVELADVTRAIADLFNEMGDYGAAEVAYRRALEIHLAALGSDSSEVASDLDGLAFNLYAQGDLPGSIAMFREAIESRRQLYAGADPSLAAALNNLALVLGAIGDYEESEELVREALAMQRVLYKEDHTDIAAGLNSLGFLLHDQRAYDEAEANYREALAMLRRLYQGPHDAVADTMNNLAFLLYDKGDIEGATDMLRESLEMNRAIHGDEHPSVARGMHNLGAWLTESGAHAEAEALLRNALELRLKLLPDGHPDTANSMTVLADLLVETGDYEEARELAAEARRIAIETYSETHWRTASAASAEGAALTELGRYPEAETLLLRSEAILAEDVGALPILLDTVKRRLARLYQAWNLPDRAAAYVTSQ